MTSNEKIQVREPITKAERLVIEHLSRGLLCAATSPGLQTIRIVDGIPIKWSKPDIHRIWVDCY